MQTIARSYRRIAFFVDLNWDRLLFPAALCAALVLGAALGTAFR